jgi:hypothetical protein
VIPGNSSRSSVCARLAACGAGVGLAATLGFADPAAERVVPPVRISAGVEARPAEGELSQTPKIPASLVPAPAPSVAVPLPPGVPPLGLPSDGEPAPAFPDLPELHMAAAVLPGAAVPADEAATDPALPDVPETDTPPESRPAEARIAADFAQWHRSPRAARDIASRENRCMLLVFTGSPGARGDAGHAGARVSRQLNAEVFATPSFNEFALDRLVLSYLDFTRSSNLELKGAELDRENAMKHCKESLNVRGFPTVILFAPDGSEIARWTGYSTDPKTGKGRATEYFAEIERAVLAHEAQANATQRRRENLRAQGYREWSSAQGSRLFAKLVEFDARTAVFRDEEGRDRTVSLRQLGIADRELITRKRLGKLPPQPR